MRVAIQLIEILPRGQHVFEERSAVGIAEVGGLFGEFWLGLRDGGIEPLPLAGGTVTQEVILPGPCGTDPILVQWATDAMQTLHALAKISRGSPGDAMQRGEFGKRHRETGHSHRGTLARFKNVAFDRSIAALPSDQILDGHRPFHWRDGQRIARVDGDELRTERRRRFGGQSKDRDQHDSENAVAFHLDGSPWRGVLGFHSPS